MEPSLPTATIRYCEYKDLNDLMKIYNHYVVHTIVSLDLDAKPVLYMQNLFNTVHNQQLPFLIVTVDNGDDCVHKKKDILGYAYANFYRRLPAFGGTVEILIYLDPKATGQGIGEKLLTVLIDTLRAVAPGTDRDHGIREVLAIVPMEEGRDASGFFKKRGFEDRGLLEGVAWKRGRWVDTRTLQRSLHEKPKGNERTVPKNKWTALHWWSSLYRRRRRLAKRME